MRTTRRAMRALTVMAAAGAFSPAAAFAMPAIGPEPSTTEPAESAATRVIREIDTSAGETTAALVLSGTALLVATAGAGYAATSRRRNATPR
jgi:hypothetical protein